LVFISIRYKKLIGEYSTSLLNGSYDDFSAQWYVDIGSKIIFTMIIEIPLPHLVPIILLAYFGLAICYDRKGSCDKT
jgi:hypothetical protein